MRIPARCRSCNGRRNLSKYPEEYVRWPTCRNCGGEMRVDQYRLKKGKKDNAPVCTDPYCCVYTPSGKWLQYHRTSTKECNGYEDYVIERSLIASKHSPITPDEECPF